MLPGSQAGSVLGSLTSPWEVQGWGGGWAGEGQSTEMQESLNAAPPLGPRTSGPLPPSHPASSSFRSVYQPVNRKKVVLT